MFLVFGALYVDRARYLKIFGSREGGLLFFGNVWPVTKVNHF